jgi:sporulation protein YlmC with PRC-barrel domain
MEIPVQAPVECTDGHAGHSVYVLINPVTDQVTHLVVKEAVSDKEYLVPVDFVSGTIAGTIRLRYNKARLKKCSRFIKTTFIEEKVPYMSLGGGDQMYGGGAYFYLPYVDSEITVQVPEEHKQIPPGELAVRRGTQVEATDGQVGHVDEFVIIPKNGHITHLVMREGHLWGQKDVIIPLSAIGSLIDDKVILKLDKQQIEALPTFPLHRRWA